MLKTNSPKLNIVMKELVEDISEEASLIENLPKKFKNNKDAIRLAREWDSQGIDLENIISRLEVLEEESMMRFIEAQEEAYEQTEDDEYWGQ